MPVYKTKNGYGVRFELPGSTAENRKRKRLSGFPTEKAAKDFLKSIDAMKVLDQFKTYHLQTVAEVMDTWHDEHVIRNCRHDSILFYEEKIKVIKDNFGKKKVEALKVGHVKSFYRVLHDMGKSQDAIKKIHKTLKSAFFYCYSMEYIPDKIMDRVKLDVYDSPNQESKLKHWNYDEIKRYLPHLKESSIYFNIYLALHLGLRAEETAAIHVSDIDFNKMTITIRHAMKKAYRSQIRGTNIIKQMDENTILTNTKNKKVNVLPLTENLVYFLKASIKHKDEMQAMYGEEYNHVYDGYLSTYDNGNIIADKQISYKFRNDVKKLLKIYPEMNRITFHGLRHSCASWLISNGVNIITVQEILNHSDLKITNIYTHSDLTQKKKALDSLNSLGHSGP
ncbi:site-specific integrase [Vallitaleaceae bacterium 9-2]